MDIVTLIKVAMRGVTVIDVVVGVAGVEVAVHEAAGTRKHHGIVCARVHW
jgi:hypothetical protein